MLRRLLRSMLLVGATASVAGAAPRHRADNMPRGFAWPPSPTMLAAATACEARLTELGIAHDAAAPAGHMVDPVTIPPDADRHAFTVAGVTYTGVFGAGPYAMDCQLAAALGELGDPLHALGVREVRFGSIYRWSQVRVSGKTKNMLSRHALGLAMDVVSVVDADGAERTVATDYKNPARNALLRAVEAAVNHSGHFRGVLNPVNDPVSHHDHLHLEADVDYTKPTS